MTIKHFDSGAIRSSDADATAYSLITPIGLRRVAATYAEGAAKYGDANWELGMPVREFIEHAIRHAYLYLSGDRSEDHLGHAAWNFMGACHSEELWPHLNTDLRVEGCKLSEATQAEIKERNSARAAASLVPPPPPAAVENDGWKVGDRGEWDGCPFTVTKIRKNKKLMFCGYPDATENTVELYYLHPDGTGTTWMPSCKCRHLPPVVENDGWKVGDRGYYKYGGNKVQFVVRSIDPLRETYATYPDGAVRLNIREDATGDGWMPSNECFHES